MTEKNEATMGKDMEVPLERRGVTEHPALNHGAVENWHISMTQNHEFVGSNPTRPTRKENLQWDY